MLVCCTNSARQFYEPPHPALTFRGLDDGTLHFTDDDVVKVKVLPVYAAMSHNRGRYLAGFGCHQEAIQPTAKPWQSIPRLPPRRKRLKKASPPCAADWKLPHVGEVAGS